MKISTDGKPAITLLYVEDDHETQEPVIKIMGVKYPRIRLLLAQNGQEGLDLYTKNCPDIVVTDVRMPVIDGIQMAKKIKEQNKDTHIIILSAYDESNYIMEAIDIGINNYVLKPVNMSKFTTALDQCLDKISLREQLKQKDEYIRRMAEDSLQVAYAEIKQLKDRLQAENIYLQEEVDQRYNFGELIGQSNVLSIVFSKVKQVSPMNATVLLLGETGTGKGVVARAIHSSSTRKGRPLITVNCTTLP
ncbi:MAG: response regulator, partial [Desulfuromonadaceae bacterium]|nr:response regulator [Desulfuromonadaceae bacterium]